MFKKIYRTITLIQICSLILLPNIVNAQENLKTSEKTVISAWESAKFPETKEFKITSKYTGHTYRIYTSISDGILSEQGLPVLWMLDGNATYPLAHVFRSQASTIPTSKEVQHIRQSNQSTIQYQGLIVAITSDTDLTFDVNRRAFDYTPVPDSSTGDLLAATHGNADLFLKFLVEELRPYIAQNYTIDPNNNTLFGFSYGGLFTLYTLLTQPQYFQNYWAASPSLWFSDALLMRKIQNNAVIRSDILPRKVMITVGQSEQFPEQALPEQRQLHLNRRAMVDNTKQFQKTLQQKNPNLLIESTVAPNMDHYDMLLHGAKRIIPFAFQYDIKQ